MNLVQDLYIIIAYNLKCPLQVLQNVEKKSIIIEISEAHWMKITFSDAIIKDIKQKYRRKSI